jgi:hypothetical protein
MHRTGCLLVRDSRVKEADNTAFLDLLERYYASSDGTSDARPEYHFQVRACAEAMWAEARGPQGGSSYDVRLYESQSRPQR